MKKHHLIKTRRAVRVIACALACVILLGACSSGGASVLTMQPGGKAPSVDEGKAHAAPAVAASAQPIAKSSWLELFLDDASKTVTIRGYSGKAQWSTLPRAARTGFYAADAHVIVGGQRLRLNTQDHAVAYGNVTTEPIAENKVRTGVQVNYLLTPNAKTAAKKKFDKTDVAFYIRVRYTLRGGNFYVEANWENASGNPDAFIESIGLMERFGALQNPGKEDFLLLPDGGGALLYPARSTAKTAAEIPEIETANLRFTVYGEDPTDPLPKNTKSLHYRDDNGKPLSANVAAFGARKGQSAFTAVVENGVSLCSVTAVQRAAGAGLISAVGARFTITPTNFGNSDTAKNTVYRAARSYGGPEHKKETLRLSYRFFQGEENVNFSTLAQACREQLINIRLLSSTKSAENTDSLPMNLTLLGAGPEGGARTLTTFEQALDILTRLKSTGIDSINVRYAGALSGGWKQRAPERLSPLARLGGSRGFEDLQEFCGTQGLALFPGALAFPGGKQPAVTLKGADLQAVLQETNVVFPDAKAEALALRKLDSIGQSAGKIIGRLGLFGTAGISLEDLGSALYADYAGGLHREQAAARINRSLPAFSAQWSVMMDTGFFHVVRGADIVVNLPLEPQLSMPGSRMEPRYEPVPFLPVLLHGSMDYSGTSINLAKNAADAYLRSVAYGACPAYTWSADAENERLFFEPYLEEAMDFYTRANRALADLRDDRIVSYRLVEPGVTETRFSNDAVLYVNFNDAQKQIENFTIPPHDFVRV